jgi:hypothetical protein
MPRPGSAWYIPADADSNQPGARMMRMARKAAAVVLALGLAGCAGPVAGSTAAGPAGSAAVPGLPVTRITVNGNGGNRVYDGIGAILGGGGNARYLMDYPEPERSRILDYLFKPGYGASLQLLKLEIGGGANSSDGSEPSIEPVRGEVNCDAGYEFAVARQAVALNPYIKLYGLQWTAPGWVGGSVLTKADIRYLLDWLGCARRHGLTISYLGGWNESDNGGNAGWWASLRSALDRAGYRSVRLVAGDSRWVYANPDDPAVAVLGAHDICGHPTGAAGGDTRCTGPDHPARGPGARKTAWASELGGVDAGAQPGCVPPCAPGMVRALVRGYHDARLTGYLEWPALDAMPPGLPYENRGLVTADQPWSGSYRVNAMTWAIAQFTQFAWPPWPGNPGGWKYVDSAAGFLRGQRADGSYVTLVRSGGGAWSTIIETTTAAAAQQASFTVTGGVSGLAGDTVHVWASDFAPATSRPSAWFVRQPDIKPAGGRFTITLRPGWVYSLTTTTGQGKGRPGAVPRASDFPLPYASGLAASVPAGTADDEPRYLAAQEGSFELRPCRVRHGRHAICTEQTTRARPVFWHPGVRRTPRYPYATVGDASLRDCTVSVDTLLTQPGTSSGLIARFSDRAWDTGRFDGYVFDVASTGAWKLIKNSAGGRITTLTSGTLATPPGTDTWHRLSLAVSGRATTVITASVDGRPVASVTDAVTVTGTRPWTSGPAGIEAGAFTGTWPQAQYSDLSITP